MSNFGKRQRLIKDGYDRMPATQFMANNSIKEVNSNNSNEDESNLIAQYDDQHMQWQSNQPIFWRNDQSSRQDVEGDYDCDGVSKGKYLKD